MFIDSNNPLGYGELRSREQEMIVTLYY
jgi:hypothetical protein